MGKNYDKRNQSIQLNMEGIKEQDLANEIAELFRGVIRWEHPYAFHNVKTPINIFAAATATMTLLFDPNLAEDKNCGGMANSEFEVVKYMAQAAGWDDNNAGGYFTFGGTSTLMSAVKIGLCKTKSDSPMLGVDDSMFVICSELEHHSIVKVCNWLGIGKNNCVKVNTDNNYQLDIHKAEIEIERNLSKGKKLAAIIACGGTTVQSIIDPINEIISLRSRIVKKYNLSYVPHLHVDAVITWPLLFFRNYDFDDNIMNFQKDALTVIREMYNELKCIELVDSFGVDFHKTGFCPFISSLFMIREKNELLLMNDAEKDSLSNVLFGEYIMADYVLESSRSLSGPMSALSMLKLLGVNGLRTKYYEMTHWGLYLREKISEITDFEIVNPPTMGVCVLFYIHNDKFCNKYTEIINQNMTKCYRFAKYNYEFYLYSIMKLQEYKILIDYSSGYTHRNEKVFMGVLKLQSFSTSLNKAIIDTFVERLVELKSNFDFERACVDFKEVSNARKFRFSFAEK